MKKCPNCNRNYDDSQSFCLEDGTALITESVAGNSQETVVLPPRKKILPFIFGIFLLLAGALIGGWFLLASSTNNDNRDNRETSVNIPTPVSTPISTPIETPTSLPSPTPTVSPEANSNISPVLETNSESIASSKPPEETNPAKPMPVIMKAEDHSVLFALHECHKSGSSITCLFSLTNKGQDRQFQLLSYRSNLYDELGNGYKGSDSQLANQTGGSPRIGFISGVTTRAQVTFDKVEPNAAKITLLNINFDVGTDYDLTVKFRNVPLLVSK